MKSRFAFAALAALLLFSACSVQQSAVAPKAPVAAAPSWDGNEQNSGIISADANGFVCTPHFLNRWDAMLANFGAKLSPARKIGDRDGITEEGTNYRFTAEAMSRFVQLNRIRKSEDAP